MMSIMLSFVVAILILIFIILVGVPLVSLIISIVGIYQDYVYDKLLDFIIWLEGKLKK